MGACSSHFPFKRHKGKPGYQHGPTNDANHSTNHPSLPSNGKSHHQENTPLQNNFSPNPIPAEQSICVSDLYNILNDSGIRPFIHDPFNFLVLDARDDEAYATSHVVTSHHHASFMRTAQSREQLSKYSVIVLYGDEVNNDNDATQQIVDLMQNVKEYVACDILVMRDGFDSFSQRYSYLCTDQCVETVDDRKLLLCYPSAVVDSVLYQGRGDQARNEVIMTTLGITHVVNISEHSNTFPQKIKYLRLPLDDMVSTNLAQHFHETCQFITDALDNHGRVLVHCNLGISRSSTITLAYLMKSRKWSLLHAYKFLKGIRIAASPNSGFLRQLSDWELEVLDERRTDIDMIMKTYGSLKR